MNDLTPNTTEQSFAADQLHYAIAQVNKQVETALSWIEITQEYQDLKEDLIAINAQAAKLLEGLNRE